MRGGGVQHSAVAILTLCFTRQTRDGIIDNPMFCAPTPREEFVNALGGVIRQVGEHVGEPGLRAGLRRPKEATVIFPNIASWAAVSACAVLSSRSASSSSSCFSSAPRSDDWPKCSCRSL